MGAFRDLTGQRFGRLTVLHTEGRNNQGKYKWLCLCDCGNTTVVTGTYLTHGDTRSCGCLHTDILIEHNKKPEKKKSTSAHNAIYKKKHGGRNSRLYRVWGGMKKRCFDTNSPAYKHYGGRGITVCEEWRSDFAAFRAWAMQNGYDENAKRGDCTIDRIDVNGNYTPDNCRWVSVAVQNRNKRKKVAQQ